MKNKLPLIVRFVQKSGRHALTLLMLAITTLVLWRTGPHQIAQDSWHVLLHGRDITANGLPTTDRFATWSAGRSWTDQQWLMHLGSYKLYQLGGWSLLMSVHWVIVLSALALILANIRAHPSRVFFIAVLTFPIIIQFVVFRSQTIAFILFALLLVAASRSWERQVIRPLLYFLPLMP